MSIILCIETATEVCSVAISIEGSCAYEKSLSQVYKHSSGLTPLIDEIMKDAELSFSDLSAVSISNGPGSYTGLRVGSATAKALCFSLGIPLIALSTLKTIAAGSVAHMNYTADYLIIPTIDARRMEVYMAVYDSSLHEISNASNLIYSETSLREISTTYQDQTLVVCGNGATKLEKNFNLPSNITVHPIDCSARYQCSLAFNKYRSTEFVPLVNHKPYYFKAPNITKPKSKL